MGEPVTERDVLLNLMGKLAGWSVEVQGERLAIEVAKAPTMFTDVHDAVRRVAKRAREERVAPAVACERELRLLRGVDEA